MASTSWFSDVLPEQNSIANLEHFKKLAAMEDRAAASEKIRWEFFRDVSSSDDYDWIESTKMIIAKCKREIISQNLGRRYNLDLTKERWWEG